MHIQISRYADYLYLIAYEINAHGWKKRLGLEGVWAGEAGCILKIVIARGGGGTIFICIFLLGVGGRRVKS